MRFPIAKLLDYAKDIPALETNPNPFAAVVLAHWQTIQTRRKPAERYQWKVRLVKSLFERGLTAEQIRQLFRLIDWLMDLPPELERQFADEIQEYEEERKMSYITSVERLALADAKKEGLAEGQRIGLQEGIELALELKFGAEGLSLLPLLQATQELDVLRSVRQAIRTADSVEQIRQLLIAKSEPDRD
jgi:flagellar biosynthesis/type III secretory pathway protein FliH